LDKGGEVKTIALLSMMVVFHFAYAETLSSPVHSIESISEEEVLIKFQNGRVAFLRRQQQDVIHQIKALPQDVPIEAKLDDKLRLEAFKIMPEKFSTTSSILNLSHRLTSFPPSLIPNLGELEKIFQRFNSNYQRSSECSNRAHVWAWEEFKNHQIFSEKVYVLFTASYINRNRFKWWFHVAPLFSVIVNNNIEKRVMDYLFDRHPKTIKGWTDNFVFSQRPCRETTKFSDYDVNPQTEDCYLMIDSMYTWNPIDLKNQELYGIYKSTFSKNDLRTAYDEAF
jgi:hypothetical protein